jgi:hypothetical protein
MRSRTTSSRRWEASSPSTSGRRRAGPVPRGMPAEQVGAARQRTDHRWAHPLRVGRWFDGPGRRSRHPRRSARVAGGGRIAGSGERVHQRGTIAALAAEDGRPKTPARPAARRAGDATSAGGGSGSAACSNRCCAHVRDIPSSCGLRPDPLPMIMMTDGSARAFGGTGPTVDNLPCESPPFQPTRGEGGGWAS